MPEIFVSSLEAKTQANGVQTIPLGVNDRFLEHQLQIEVSAQPAAGTLAVAVQTPGAPGFGPIETVNLALVTPAAPKIVQFHGFVSRIQMTPANLDADKTYSVYMVSGGAR